MIQLFMSVLNVCNPACGFLRHILVTTDNTKNLNYKLNS